MAPWPHFLCKRKESSLVPLRSIADAFSSCTPSRGSWDSAMTGENTPRRGGETGILCRLPALRELLDARVQRSLVEEMRPRFAVRDLESPCVELVVRILDRLARRIEIPVRMARLGDRKTKS